MHRNPLRLIVPEGLRPEVGNAFIPQYRRGWKKAYPDYAYGDACKGSNDIPKGATFRTGETPKLGNEPRKTVQTVRDRGENGAKVGVTKALAWRVCRPLSSGINTDIETYPYIPI